MCSEVSAANSSVREHVGNDSANAKSHAPLPPNANFWISPELRTFDSGPAVITIIIIIIISSCQLPQQHAECGC